MELPALLFGLKIPSQFVGHFSFPLSSETVLDGGILMTQPRTNWRMHGLGTLVSRRNSHQNDWKNMLQCRPPGAFSQLLIQKYAVLGSWVQGWGAVTRYHQLGGL